MSLTKVRDVDYLICMRLNEKDLVSFCKVNKYYGEIYIQPELWKRKIYQLGAKFFDRSLNRSYYFELYNSLKTDFVKEIFLAIHNDRPDILFLILTKKDVDPNRQFVLNNEYTLYSKSYCSCEIYDNNFPMSYSPIAMIITKRSEVMWNILKCTKYPLLIEDGYYVLAIASKNMNILEDLLETRSEIKSYILYFALRSYNEEATKLLLKYISVEIIEHVFDAFFVVIESEPEYLDWIKVRNNAFTIFLLDERVKRNLGFFHFYDLQDNFSKLLKAYFAF